MSNPLEREPVTDEEVSRYYQWQFASIKAGATEFVVRNFDADFGRVHDLYKYTGKVQLLGYVHQEYDWGCTAYQAVGRTNLSLNKEPLSLEDAKDKLMEITDGVQDFS